MWSNKIAEMDSRISKRRASSSSRLSKSELPAMNVMIHFKIARCTIVLKSGPSSFLETKIRNFGE